MAASPTAKRSGSRTSYGAAVITPSSVYTTPGSATPCQLTAAVGILHRDGSREAHLRAAQRGR